MLHIEHLVLLDDQRRFADEYNASVRSERIAPFLVEDLQDFDYRGIDLLVAWKESSIAGLLTYRLIQPTVWFELVEQKASQGFFAEQIIDRDGLLMTFYALSQFAVLKEYQGRMPLAKPYLLESFQKGAGSALVNALNETEVAEGIILAASFNSSGFFAKIGFEGTGYYVGDRDTPIMVRMKM